MVRFVTNNFRLKVMSLSVAITALVMAVAHDLFESIWAGRTMLISLDKLGATYFLNADTFLGSHAYWADVIGAGFIGLFASIVYLQVHRLRMNRNWWANAKFALLVLVIATVQYQGGVSAAAVVAFGFPAGALILRQVTARALGRESAMMQLFYGLARIAGSMLIALPLGIGITAGLALGPVFAVPMVGLAVFSIKLIGRLAFFIRTMSRHTKRLDRRQTARQYNADRLAVA